MRKRKQDAKVKICPECNGAYVYLTEQGEYKCFCKSDEVKYGKGEIEK